MLFAVLEFRGIAISKTVALRRNTYIGVPLYLSTPMEMGCIEPLVENENLTKQQRKVKLAIITYVIYEIKYKYSSCYSMHSRMSMNRSGEDYCRISVCFLR